MEIEEHEVKGQKMAEVKSDQIVVATVEDGLDLLGNLYYQGFDTILIYEKNITPAFFDLRTGIAGEILQKFSNYRVRLAIVGDFESYQSKSIRDFMFESNKTGHINFVPSKAEALDALSR
ncbi:DUF4180 domain-containing protein [Larkinella rosea]|uniref:DUF4180 domain-containing protein n=1 Tax=Larkinella rosea TaxID=2025312 RepID=A0A3P1C3J7_9BACT|nr:DUF4180 domain-containing protein [Larkinella rosea]RRB07394.1 DUF4180 domain-containing protein [Larkinella rosea]